MTGLSPEAADLSDDYWTAWRAAVDARDQAGAEYAGWALHHRQPVNDQGDTSDTAWRYRAEQAEQAALRWLELSAEVRQIERAERIRRQAAQR